MYSKPFENSIAPHTTEYRYNSFISSVQFSPDGKTLVTSGQDYSIKLWNIEQSQEYRSLNGHTESVWSVSFSPDGKTLASGSIDKTIKLWNTETGEVIKPLNGHTKSVWSVSFSPDGKTLASGSTDTLVTS